MCEEHEEIENNEKCQNLFFMIKVFDGFFLGN
jgi:hypothetical protein